MKKTVRIIAVVMVVLMLCLALASCAKTLSGKYTANYLGTGIAMTFDGSDVEIAFTAAGINLASVDATYTIEDDKIAFDFADEDKVTNAVVKGFLATLESPVPFAEGDGYIEVGGVKYVEAAE